MMINNVQIVVHYSIKIIMEVIYVCLFHTVEMILYITTEVHYIRIYV